MPPLTAASSKSIKTVKSSVTHSAGTALSSRAESASELTNFAMLDHFKQKYALLALKEIKQIKPIESKIDASMNDFKKSLKARNVKVQSMQRSLLRNKKKASEHLQAIGSTGPASFKAVQIHLFDALTVYNDELGLTKSKMLDQETSIENQLGIVEEITEENINRPTESIHDVEQYDRDVEELFARRKKENLDRHQKDSCVETVPFAQTDEPQISESLDSIKTRRMERVQQYKQEEPKSYLTRRRVIRHWEPLSAETMVARTIYPSKMLSDVDKRLVVPLGVDYMDLEDFI